MNVDAVRRDLDQALIELGQDVIYPNTPDMDAKVMNRIAVKAAGSRPGIPRMSRRLVLGMAAAATVVIATVLALSPAARATLTPWWASDSNCPGPISGQQLVIKSATAKQLCNSGIVLTRPVGQAVIRRSQAIAAARKRFPFKSVRETVLATVHEQGSVPPQTWLAWVISIPPGGRPAGGGPAPTHDRRVATRKYHGLFFLVFIDARSGKFHEATASYALVRPPAPRYVYSAVTFTDGKDGFILAAKPSTGRYLLATTDDGRTWMPRRLPFSPNWFQFVNARDGWATACPFCSADLPRGVSSENLYRTFDGGRSWRRLPNIRNPLHIQFITSRRGWLQTYVGTFETSDGGRSWKRARWPFGTSSTWHFFNATFGWASASVRRQPRHATCLLTQLFVTWTGGQSWTRRPIRPGCYGAPSFANSRDGWMIVDPAELDGATGTLIQGSSNCSHGTGTCPQALLRTVNGGRSWTTEHSVTHDEVPPGASPNPAVQPYWPGGWVGSLGQPVFADQSHGWILSGSYSRGAPVPPGWQYGGVSTSSNDGRSWHLRRLHIRATVLANSWNIVGSTVGADLAPTSGAEAWLTVDNTPWGGHSFVLHTRDDGRHWRVVDLGGYLR